MNQSTLRKIGKFLFWVLVIYIGFWFFSLFQLVEFSPWLIILVPFGLSGAKLYYHLLAPAIRHTVLTSLGKYWWVWGTALTLAILSTIVLPLTALRYQGFPWGYMVFWMFIFWTIFIVTIFCIMDDTFAARVGRGISNWAKLGGFWKIWTENNTPAHSLLVIWLVLVFIAILYGPPNDFLLDTKELVLGGVEKLRETSAWMKFQEALDTLYGIFFGRSPTIPVIESQKEILEPIYRKGWFWIRVVIFLFPIMVFTLIWSRRDESADRIDAFLDFFKKKRAEILSLRSGAPVQAPTTQGTTIVPVTPVSGSVPFWHTLTSDVVAEFIIGLGSTLSKLLRRTK